MPTPVDFDVIEQLARAILGQLAPITGERGTGTATVTNPTPGAIELPKNMCLLPVIAGELADDLVFKVAPNPATTDPHGVGGEWSIPAGGSLSVALRSNLGGARHNLPAGTVLRFDPLQDGLDETVTLDGAITDGADAPDDALSVRRAVYYEDLDAAQVERDISAGRLARLPGIMLVWTQSTPAEGRTAGTNQGSTRLADGVRLFAENYRLFVVSATLANDGRRRRDGLRILQAVTRLLTDQQITTDGEQLTAVGSLEILNRSRFVRGPKHYVYALTLRVNRVITRTDTRSFVPWLRTHLQQALPGRTAPEPTTPLVDVDIGVPIPPGPLGP
jgi:hypothetical protein